MENCREYKVELDCNANELCVWDFDRCIARLKLGKMESKIEAKDIRDIITGMRSEMSRLLILQKEYIDMLNPRDYGFDDDVEMVKSTSSFFNEDVLAKMLYASVNYERRDITAKLIDFATEFNIEFSTNESQSIIEAAMEYMARFMTDEEESDFSYLFYILRNWFNIEPDPRTIRMYERKVADYPNMMVNKIN